MFRNAESRYASLRDRVEAQHGELQKLQVRCVRGLLCMLSWRCAEAGGASKLAIGLCAQDGSKPRRCPSLSTAAARPAIAFHWLNSALPWCAGADEGS